MIKLKSIVPLSLAFGFTLLACSPVNAGKPPAAPPSKNKVPSTASTLVFGAGCFWCVETMFEELKGVYDVESGYAGGTSKGVTYEDVCTGTTGHAETIKVSFDPKVITREDLLRIFFTVHDPTTLNRQGADTGTQYRSVIFYSTPEEKAVSEKIKAEISKSKIWKNPIVTTIEPLKNYTVAEAYHQDYYARYEAASDAEKAKFNLGYCNAVVEPKVLKFREKYRHLLKNP